MCHWAWLPSRQRSDNLPRYPRRPRNPEAQPDTYQKTSTSS